MTSIIEARAIAIHETRKAGAARRSRVLADMMTFDGAERAFCMAEARNRIDEEGYLASQQTAADRYYADWLAGLTDADIAGRIAAIDEEVAGLPYRSLTVNIADRGAGLADERRRLADEQGVRARNAVEAA